VLAITDKLGHRALYISPGANTLLNRKDINPSYFNQASIVYFSPFVGERQFQLQKEIARQLSPQVRLSFAPGALYASRGLKALKTILSRTHILFLNQAEIEQLTGHDFRDGTSICLNEGCQQAVVTFGKGKLLAGVKGTVTDYIRDKNREYFIVPRKARIARVVDTTGAGDAFAAGYLFGFLKGKNPDECGLIGDMVARFSLCRLGARDGLPTRAELSEAYHELYQKTL
jgi:ribokinase